MNMKTTRFEKASYAALLTGAATLGALLADGGEAKAWWARQAPQYCNFSSTIVNNEGCNTSSANSASAYCPVNDTSANPKSSLTALNVHVEGNGFLSSATRCVRFWNALGGSCGSPATSFATGLITLQPSTFAGWTAGDFGYLVVLVNGKNGNTSSCLKGYYTAG